MKGRWGRDERPEIELSGQRAEFRIALQEEIAAARRNAASSGVPLVNGRRIARVGGAFQYAFAIQNAINAPGDQPADLHVPGRAPVEATVISVAGLAVTISVAEDLGEVVAYGTLRSDLTLLLRRLISRIEDLAETENPAGDRLLGQSAPAGAAVSQRVTELNDEQAEAVASSLGRDTTFIWGPPGTGKTRTIGTVGEQLYRRGRSVLLVSHTNAAVDQALIHIAGQLGDAMTEGSVMRVGDPVDLRLRELPGAAGRHSREAPHRGAPSTQGCVGGGEDGQDDAGPGACATDRDVRLAAGGHARHQGHPRGAREGAGIRTCHRGGRRTNRRAARGDAGARRGRRRGRAGTGGPPGAR